MLRSNTPRTLFGVVVRKQLDVRRAVVDTIALLGRLMMLLTALLAGQAIAFWGTADFLTYMQPALATFVVLLLLTLSACGLLWLDRRGVARRA